MSPHAARKATRSPNEFRQFIMQATEGLGFMFALVPLSRRWILRTHRIGVTVEERQDKETLVSHRATGKPATLSLRYLYFPKPLMTGRRHPGRRSPQCLWRESLCTAHPKLPTVQTSLSELSTSFAQKMVATPDSRRFSPSTLPRPAWTPRFITPTVSLPAPSALPAPCSATYPLPAVREAV